MGRAAVGRMSHRFAPGRCPKLAQRRSRDKGPANHSLMFFLAARSAIRWKPIRFHACRRISEFPTLLSRSNHHLCHSLFPCPLQIQDNAEYRQWPLSTRNPPVGDIHATNLGLYALHNIITHQQFQFQFISVHIVWTAYNYYVIRSYRHHQKFRLELSSQFFPNLIKLISFDFHVWQEFVLIPKVPKSLEHPHTLHFWAFWSFDLESCEALHLEFGDDSWSSSELLWWMMMKFDQSCFECPEIRVPVLVVNARQWRALEVISQKWG